MEGPDERAGILMLPVVIFPLLYVLDLDVHGQAFG